MGERESRVRAWRSPVRLLALGALALTAGPVPSQESVSPPFPSFKVLEVTPEDREAIEKLGCRTLHGVGVKNVGGHGFDKLMAAASVCESHGAASGFARHYLVACQLEGDWECQERGEFLAAQLAGGPVNIFMEGDVADVAFPAARFAVENQYVKPEKRLDVTQVGEHWIDSLHVERAGPQLLRFLSGNEWVSIEYASTGPGLRFKRVELPKPGDAGTPPPDAERAWRELMKASENLDLEKVIGSFADDATMFFPMTESPQRFGGKESIRAYYVKVFENVRRRSASQAPPYQKLVPEDIAWHVAGPDAAIVTFHIRGGQDLARRTVVLARRDGTWLVVHLHASNLPVGPND